MKIKQLWNNKNIDVIKINNKWYVLYGWNGETYNNCWRTNAQTYYIKSDKNKYNIKPIYEHDEINDCFDIINYEII